MKGISGQGSAIDLGGRTRRWRVLVVAFLGILLGAATGLHAQGVRYDNIVLGPRGGPVASATVAVCAAGATTSATPCSPLATIYSDEALQQPMANPFQADSLGNYGFWAAPGHYVVQIYGAGVTTRVMNVFLPCDPSNCSMANATFSSITAGTLNLTGSLTVNGRSVATQPKPGDSVMFVSPNGSDSNDGLSWGTAKQTLYAAVSAIESQTSNSGWAGGTIYVADGVACGGPVTGQGLWLYGGTGASPGTGWIKLASALNIVGVGTTHWVGNSYSPQVIMNCGSATQPAVELQYTNVPLRLSRLEFTGSIGLDLLNNDTSLIFDDDSFAVDSSVATNGPAVLIGPGVFWAYFRHCTFQGNTSSSVTLGSDASEAVVINPNNGGPNTGQNTGLIFIDESQVNNGSVKFETASTSASMYVNGLVTENQRDGKGAVWITNVNGGDVFDLRNITVADATVNPTPAVQIDAGNTDDTFVTGAAGYGVNVTGPATVLTRYGSNNQNLTALPSVQNQIGFFDGKLLADSAAGVRLFSPVASRFTNVASQVPSTWAHSGMSETNVAAPDGTSDAGELTNSNTSLDGPIFYQSLVSVSNGDYLIGGVWVQNPTGSGTYAGGAAATISVTGCTGVTETSLASGASIPYLGGGWLASGSSGEWEWWPFAVKLGGLSTSPSSCQINFTGDVAANGGQMTYYAPTLFHVATGTITDSEASWLGLTIAPYPDGLTPPVEATLRGHPFAFGGSGDNYFATLDHTALSANQTYDFPNASGTIALSGANGVSAGTITLSSGAGSHTFATAYASAPVCTASDTTAANAVQVTSSTTAVSVTGTGSDVVAWVCAPAAN